MRRPSKRETIDLPAWIVSPFVLSYLTSEQIALDGLYPLFASMLFHDAVDLWCRLEGRRQDWTDLDLPIGYPLDGGPTTQPPAEILAAVYAASRADPFRAHWHRSFGIAHDSDDEVAS